jgi:hypothetical protein
MSAILLGRRTSWKEDLGPHVAILMRHLTIARQRSSSGAAAWLHSCAGERLYASDFPR